MPDRERLEFLLDTVLRESKHLQSTDRRLFASPFTVERALALNDDEADAERCDAFVSRFSPLQDTLGDKLLPELLRQLAEPVGPAIDNLDRAEKLCILPRPMPGWQRAGCAIAWCTNTSVILSNWPAQ